ncbi:hypothetical protein DFH09DRAFT_1100526 [Mycena vulgaris]|nr:hypothetical protein DFH09DRAFT_1100526 [Mycena vulgaris]
MDHHLKNVRIFEAIPRMTLNNSLCNNPLPHLVPRLVEDDFRKWKKKRSTCRFTNSGRLNRTFLCLAEFEASPFSEGPELRRLAPNLRNRQIEQPAVERRLLTNLAGLGGVSIYFAQPLTTFLGSMRRRVTALYAVFYQWRVAVNQESPYLQIEDAVGALLDLEVASTYCAAIIVDVY